MPRILMDVNESPWNLAGRSIRLTPGEVHVWLSSASDASSSMDLIERTLSSAEIVRAARFRREENRLEFTLGRGLLRLFLGAYLDQDPGNLQLIAGPHGKPELVTSPETLPIQFNVSHSDGAVLHAFALILRVGVDIERVRQDFSGLDVARRFFSRREAAFLSSQPEAMQPRAFFTVWTRKEALLKALGEGLARSLERTEIPIPPDRPEIVIELPEGNGENVRWSLLDLDAGPDFAATLAAEGMGLRVTLRKWVGDGPRHEVNEGYQAQAAGAAEPGRSRPA